MGAASCHINARQKLDVVNKTRSNIFGWRGQFTPGFGA